jgi:hypothetical protein
VPAPNEHPEQAVTAQPERAGLRHRHATRDIQARVVPRPLVLHFQFPAVFRAGLKIAITRSSQPFPTADKDEHRAAGDQLVRRKVREPFIERLGLSDPSVSRRANPHHGWGWIGALICLYRNPG